MQLERRVERVNEGPKDLVELAPIDPRTYTVRMTAFAGSPSVHEKINPPKTASFRADFGRVLDSLKEEVEKMGLDPQRNHLTQIQFDVTHPETDTEFVFVVFLEDENISMTGGDYNRLTSGDYLDRIEEAMVTSIDYINAQIQDEVSRWDKMTGKYDI